MTETAPVRFCAIVEYDGTSYRGFQRQRTDQPTIQGELEKALRKISHHPVPILGSGRTDSGVHATGQVIAFDLGWRHGEEKLLKALNSNLPSDIAILEVTAVAADFHPRFDAKRRTYHYYIENCSGLRKRPLTRNRHWQIPNSLNLDMMNEASQHLLGEHDFATFGQPPQGNNSVRTVFTAEWRQLGNLYIFKIEANAFLYRMVRSLVGSLKLVGDGTWAASHFVQALESCDRSQAGTTAPAQGLYLTSVKY